MQQPEPIHPPSHSWIPESDLEIKRRYLPHWSLDGARYYITFCLRNGTLSHDEIQLVVQHLKSGEPRFYRLISASVMPDHVHVILVPNPGIPLSRIMQGIKGPTARAINLARKSSGPLWQDERWDRILRDEEELQEKLRYMLQNPVEEGLTDDPWSYPGWYLSEV